MSGHNRASQLGQEQKAVSFEGRFLQFNSGTPSNGVSGFGKGALAIDSQNGKLYINEGTSQSATWSEVTGSGGEEFIYSQPGVAESVSTNLVSGKANLTIIGDSISNSASTSFDTLSKGVIEHFKPNQWRGLFFEPSGGVPGTIWRTVGGASNSGSPGDSGYFASGLQAANDGNMTAYAPALEGEYCATAHVFAFDDARSAGSTIANLEFVQDALQNAVPSASDYPNFGRDKLFENAAGAVDFFEPAKFGSAGAATFGAVYITSATAATGFAFEADIKNRLFANNTVGDDFGNPSSYKSDTLTVSGITEQLVLHPVDFSPSITYSTGTGAGARLRHAIHQTTAGGGSGDDRLVAVAAGYIGYTDAQRSTGLRVNTIARGGAQTKNFILEPGEAGIPEASGVDWAWTDEAFARRLGVTETNIVLMHIGANNNTVKSVGFTNYDAQGYVDDVAAIMDRMQAAATAASLSALKFILIGQINPVYSGYTVSASTWDTGDTLLQHANYTNINNRLISLSKSRNDFVYFDLESYLNTTAYNTNGYLSGRTTVNDLLDDGVHPNALGADVIMSALWSKISALGS